MRSDLGENLEFMSFGTLLSYQRQGFGRKMLHFVYEEAKKEKYDGVNLWTVKDRPAFLLYSKEGFQVEKEFTLFGRIPLCWMRKTFTESMSQRTCGLTCVYPNRSLYSGLRM